MLTYRVTRRVNTVGDKSTKHSAHETTEIEAKNIGAAFKILGWEPWEREYSVNFVSDPGKMWNTAKNRIRKILERTPAEVELLSDEHVFELVKAAHMMDDVQLLEALANKLEQEQRDFDFPPGDEALNITAYLSDFLSDTHLLVTFAEWQLWAEEDEYERSHCHYCGQQGDTVEWNTSPWEATSGQKGVFVCLENKSCWQKALNDGYRAVSENRRRILELWIQGKIKREEFRPIHELLGVSRATIYNDRQILKDKRTIVTIRYAPDDPRREHALKLTMEQRRIALDEYQIKLQEEE